MNIFDKGFRWIAEQNKIAKENEQFFARLRRQRQLFNSRKEEYWHVALTLHEAIKANSKSLQVQIPHATKQLMPPDYEQKGFPQLHFVIRRDPSNTPCSINPTLPHEVVRDVTAHMSICGYSGFVITCTEDTYRYYVTIHKDTRFCLGGVLDPNVGEIIFNNGYYVDLCQGGLPQILPTTILAVYRYGSWYKSSICLDANGYPYLQYFNEPLKNFVGCIARI